MSVALSDRRVILAANLAVPGGGLILVGRPWVGAALALVFAVCANAVVAATLIFPDDVPWAMKVLAALGTAASYLGAQYLLVSSIRAGQHDEDARRRSEALKKAVDCLGRGEAARGLEQLAALGEEGGRDLLVAYRRAQLLSLTDDAPAARAAWQIVRVLDRHGIYREATAAALNPREEGGGAR